MPDIALCAAVDLGDAGQVPEWLHLLPAGIVRTSDGRGPYHVSDGAQLLATSMAGGKLPVDECHATDLAAPKGGAAPARGWIVELQSRADGIWGRVEWTGEGRRIVRDREYRALSPVILHDKAGHITAILRASLTNTPNLTGLIALHSKDTDMQLRDELVKMLDLSAAADDRMILAKVAELVKRHTGKDVALQSTGARADQLALQAAAYQTKFANSYGLTIDFATAVRAVASGAS